MTKETMKKILKSRVEKIKQRKKEERQKFEEQKKRLLSLVENMKEDLEIKELLCEANISNVIAPFYWNEREDKMGFSDKIESFFIQSLFFSEENEEKYIGFTPCDVDKNNIEENIFTKNYYRDLVRYNEDFDANLITYASLKHFCDCYEKFHKDFHSFLDSKNWEEIEN